MLIFRKVPEIARPRPANLTSIPSLLSVFQSEWDALALETFQLRKQLLDTRQELSTALYQHDAACRVILRLQKERDEAREALSKVSIDGVGAAAAEDMDVDTAEGLPTSVKDKINSFKEEYFPPSTPISNLCAEVDCIGHMQRDVNVNFLRVILPSTRCAGSTFSPEARKSPACSPPVLLTRLQTTISLCLVLKAVSTPSSTISRPTNGKANFPTNKAMFST